MPFDGTANTPELDEKIAKIDAVTKLNVAYMEAMFQKMTGADLEKIAPMRAQTIESAIMKSLNAKPGDVICYGWDLAKQTMEVTLPQRRSFDFPRDNAISRTLRQALGYIDTPDKWVQGRLSLLDRVCALGAVQRVHPEMGRAARAASDYLARAVRLILGEPMSVADYNDGWGRKHSEIVTLFEQAIALAESEGV